MFFVVRGGVFKPVAAMTFRRFMREGFEGQEATLADWETHLSTLFPEVRLKRYVEVRGADAGPLELATALPALWRGLLDDRAACAAAWSLVANHPFEARESLRRAVPREGLSARLGAHTLRDLAVELVRIAKEGLRRLPTGQGDVPLLAPLEASTAAGRCPADAILADFIDENGDPTKLVKRWSL
jgi:glutamate--cysteine ligase